MGWVKAKWIPRLFAAFDACWPGRTRAQDGTIGNAAHQDSPSAHNPDDTPGSLPERQDSDSKAEVRGADVDARGVPMQAVIDGILASPAERARFIYIIFNGSIWSAAYGWARRTYTGSDQHLTHAHFSGDPAYDEDDRPFPTITGGSTVDTKAESVIKRWAQGMPTDTDGQAIEPVKWRISDEAFQAKVAADLTALKAREVPAIEPIDYTKLAKALLAEIN